MDNITYRSYRTRFSVLALFCLGNASNAFLWICFSPIFDATARRFQVSNFAVNMLSLVFLIVYLPASVLTVYLTERYGLRAAILSGCGLNAIGGWLRFIACYLPPERGASFGLLLIGQLFGAVAQPFFTNLPARVSADWFTAGHRDGATVVGSMANPIGNALGSIIPALVVGSPDDMPTFLLGQAVVFTVLALISFVGVPTAPLTPPSAAAEKRMLQRAQIERAAGANALSSPSATPTSSLAPSAADSLLDRADSEAQLGRDESNGCPSLEPLSETVIAKHALSAMMSDVRWLLRSRNFMFLCVGFGVGLGVFNALLTLLAQLLQPCGYSADTAGTAGAALLGAGLVAAGIAGGILEKTRAYVPLLRLGIVAALASTLFMLSSLRAGDEGTLIASFGVLGFFLIPLLPVALENAAECSYPIPEDTSSALLMTMGQLVGIVLIFALPPLMSLPASAACDSVATPAAGFILGWMMLAAVSIAFFRKDYRRQAAELTAAGE